MRERISRRGKQAFSLFGRNGMADFKINCTGHEAEARKLVLEKKLAPMEKWQLCVAMILKN